MINGGDMNESKDRAAMFFCAGFMDGRRTRVFFSRKQAEAKYPRANSEQINAYLNGRDDGVQRDTFRYDLIRRKNNA
jgi:hypothetical protein